MERHVWVNVWLQYNWFGFRARASSCALRLFGRQHARSFYLPQKWFYCYCVLVAFECFECFGSRHSERSAYNSNNTNNCVRKMRDISLGLIYRIHTRILCAWMADAKTWRGKVEALCAPSSGAGTCVGVGKMCLTKSVSVKRAFFWTLSFAFLEIFCAF